MKRGQVGDPLGWRKIFGVITPSTNTIVQPEYDEMRPAGVTNQVARIHISDQAIETDGDFEEHIAEIDRGIEAAFERIITCHPDHLILGISAVSIWGDGLDPGKRLEERVLERFGGIGLSQASTAIPLALQAHGLDGGRLGIVTPYMPVAERYIRQFLNNWGYEVLKSKHLKGKSPARFSDFSGAELRSALNEVDGIDIQAIVQFGANLCMARLAGEAERWLEKPVVAVNTATYWSALRKNHINDRIWGFGTLLERY